MTVLLEHTHRTHKSALLTLGVVACVGLTSLVITATSSADTTGVGEACETINSTEDLEEVSKYAPPVALFSDSGTTVHVICDPGTRTRKAHLVVGTGNENFLIYTYAYERDTVAKKWRKIKLSGEKTIGAWITGSAAAELSYIPKKGLGEVLVYTCEQTNGTWRCGCKDSTCSPSSWQMQKYDFNRKPQPVKASENVSTDTDYPKSFTKATYLTTYPPSSKYMKVGENITVSGSGFESGVMVHFENGTVVPTNVVSPSSLSFTVPTIQPGFYKAWYTLGNKRSKNDRYVILNPQPEPVQIYEIKPTTFSNNSTVTITGSGFTPEGNTVYIWTYRIPNINSTDGKTLSFQVKPEKVTMEDLGQEALDYLPKQAADYFLNLDKIPVVGGATSMPLQVINANGESNAVTVTIK